MQVYRVFPHDPAAGPDEPGHPLHVHPDQGTGQWDNPDRYGAVYVAASAEGAIGETFAHLSRWTPTMLPVPTVRNGVRALGVYRIEEEVTPLLDLDDARTLLDRGLRPTDVVIRNRPRTQQIALRVHGEARWAGLSWWSMHRPQWTLYVLWRPTALVVVAVEPLVGHPSLLAAGTLLGKELDRELLSAR